MKKLRKKKIWTKEMKTNYARQSLIFILEF